MRIQQGKYGIHFPVFGEKENEAILAKNQKNVLTQTTRKRAILECEFNRENLAYISLSLKKKKGK